MRKDKELVSPTCEKCQHYKIIEGRCIKSNILTNKQFSCIFFDKNTNNNNN